MVVITYSLDEYVTPMVMPWREVLADLDRAGKNIAAISELTGIPETTVKRYLTGSEPKHSVAIALLRIHTRYCGDRMTYQRVTESVAKG